jgi:hypothetical protein
MGDGDTIRGGERGRELVKELRRLQRRQLMKDVLYSAVLVGALSVAALYIVPKIIKNQLYSNNKAELERDIARVELSSVYAEYRAITAQRIEKNRLARIAYENDPKTIAKRKAYDAKTAKALERMRKEDEAFQLQSRLERIVRYKINGITLSVQDAVARHKWQQEELVAKVIRYFRDGPKKTLPKFDNPGLADYPAPFVVGGIPNSILAIRSGN